MKTLILALLFVICFTCYAGAEDGVIYSTTDPAGDDYGPGTYEYPENKVFKPYQGLFDITGFKIKEEDENYIFIFDFGKITDPWDSKFGFSLPLLELYIDNEAGGEDSLFQEGANIRLDHDHPWNKLIKISGWWVRVFSPGDLSEENDKFLFEADDFPGTIDDCDVEVIDNRINVRINKKYIGPVSGSYIYLMVGSFDPFGLDHFRDVNSDSSDWAFYFKGDGNPDFAPRVIDLLLSSRYDQKEILANFDEENYCQIYPIRVVNNTNKMGVFSVNTLFYIAFIFLIMVIVFMNKNTSFSHTKNR